MLGAWRPFNVAAHGRPHPPVRPARSSTGGVSVLGSPAAAGGRGPGAHLRRRRPARPRPPPRRALPAGAGARAAAAAASGRWSWRAGRAARSGLVAGTPPRRRPRRPHLKAEGETRVSRAGPRPRACGAGAEPRGEKGGTRLGLAGPRAQGSRKPPVGPGATAGPCCTGIAPGRGQGRPWALPRWRQQTPRVPRAGRSAAGALSRGPAHSVTCHTRQTAEAVPPRSGVVFLSVFSKMGGSSAYDANTRNTRKKQVAATTERLPASFSAVTAPYARARCQQPRNVGNGDPGWWGHGVMHASAPSAAPPTADPTPVPLPPGEDKMTAMLPR